MDNPWKCGHCGERFADREDWVTHLSMVHGVEEDADAEVAPQ